MAEEKFEAHVADQEPSLDDWIQYAIAGNAMINNGKVISQRVQDMRPKLFCKPDKMVIDVLDVVKITPNTINNGIRQQTLSSLKSVEESCLKNDWDTRFISICAPNSIKPLKVTNEAMHTLLSHYNVGPQFLDLLLSFATGVKETEAGPGSMTVKKYEDGSFEMQYRLSYVEEVKKASNISWAIRQTGVYHRHMPTGPGSLWIFLHPRPNSTLQTRLEKSIKEWSRKQRSLIELQLVHLIPLSSYIGDWRWYLKNLSAEIETFASIAMSIDFSKEGYHGRGTNTLQSLHNLQDKVSPLFARLRSTLRTVASLKRYKKSLNNSNNSIPAQTKEILGELESYETSLHGNLASVTLLERRTQEILNLLVVALNLKSQATAVKINRNIWSLTKDTVDDSATVRLVTMVTLIYLPASFVTVGLSPIMPGAKLRSSQQSLLGMNLFTFQTTEGSGFQVSKQFWLFFAILIPLTLLTIGSWIIMARRIHERKRRDREKAESTGPIDEDLWPSTH